VLIHPTSDGSAYFEAPADRQLFFVALDEKDLSVKRMQSFASIQDPAYQQLLEGLKQGKAILDSEPRFGTPAFKPNSQYVRELKRYGVIPRDFDLARQPLDYFAADQAYWRSLWTTPSQATFSR